MLTAKEEVTNMKGERLRMNSGFVVEMTQVQAHGFQCMSLNIETNIDTSAGVYNITTHTFP